MNTSNVTALAPFQTFESSSALTWYSMKMNFHFRVKLQGTQHQSHRDRSIAYSHMLKMTATLLLSSNKPARASKNSKFQLQDSHLALGTPRQRSSTGKHISSAVKYTPISPTKLNSRPILLLLTSTMLMESSLLQAATRLTAAPP